MPGQVERQWNGQRAIGGDGSNAGDARASRFLCKKTPTCPWCHLPRYEHPSRNRTMRHRFQHRHCAVRTCHQGHGVVAVAHEVPRRSQRRHVATCTSKMPVMRKRVIAVADIAALQRLASAAAHPRAATPRRSSRPKAKKDLRACRRSAGRSRAPLMGPAAGLPGLSPAPSAPAMPEAHALESTHRP